MVMRAEIWNYKVKIFRSTSLIVMASFPASRWNWKKEEKLRAVRRARYLSDFAEPDHGLDCRICMKYNCVDLTLRVGCVNVV